jgi:hypothetical protein
MGSNRSSRIAVTASMIALAAAPAATAMQPKDYSKNGATGDYAAQRIYKDYSKNGATGDYSPAAVSTIPSVRIVKQERSFAWGDAALGGASTLALVLFFGLTARRVRRRRIPAPAPARPSAA